MRVEKFLFLVLGRKVKLEVGFGPGRGRDK